MKPWRPARSRPVCHSSRKNLVQLLKTSYSWSSAEAAETIPAALSSFYLQGYPDVAAKQAPEIHAAGVALAAIYQRNVFPDLKVTWGTYPNNLGHTDAPGCFRCHDEAHLTADKKTISQDCSLCHQLVAVDEASPDVLKTLELKPNTKPLGGSSMRTFLIVLGFCRRRGDRRSGRRPESRAGRFSKILQILPRSGRCGEPRHREDV